jgi:glycosyltransferase involved in cell wall biosynthesis
MNAAPAASAARSSAPPILSIVTPTYNDGEFLEQTITSIINQDYAPIELIVIDGGSTDDTLDVIRRYAPHLAYWVSEPDRGQADALRKGFAVATGAVVAWQNADDYYEPNVFGQVMRVFHDRAEVDLVYGNIRIVDAAGRPVDELRHTPMSYWASLFGDLPFQNHAAFFRRSLWERIGGIVSEERFFDPEIVLRAARLGHPHFIRKILGNYRRHAGSMTFSGEYQLPDPWVLRRRHLGRWASLPTWCMLPLVALAKGRRLAHLAWQGDADYVLKRVRRQLSPRR